MEKLNENKSAIDFDKMRHERDPILKEFSLDFMKEVRINPTYNVVYSMLQDKNITLFNIIEELLKQNKILNNELKNINHNYIKHKIYGE